MWGNEEAVQTVVVYGGRTGTCRWYAEKIAGARDADLMSAGQAKLSAVKGYRTLIFVLPVYDGRLEGIDGLTHLYPKLMKVTRSYADDLSGPEGEKRIAVLAVGLGTEEEAWSDGALDLPGALSEVPVYYARGRFAKEDLDWKGRMRMEILEKAQAQGEPLPAWAKAALEAMRDGTGELDLTEEAYIDPILDVIDGRG